MNINMLLIASEYYDVAMHCWERASVIPGSIDKPVSNTRLMFVGTMNMAFAIEVALKARLPKIEKDHHLDALFDLLEENEQKNIIGGVANLLDEYKTCWDENSFRFYLKQSSNNFVEARYSYEEKAFSVAPMFLDALAQVLLKEQGINRPWRWAKPITFGKKK